ncbi:MAG: aminoacyl-tRNA hydrolase [Armatimonadota bacterium]
MKLIVGLGNPGPRYAHTRHNVGFDVLDIFARRRGIRILGRQDNALVGRCEHAGEEILLAKPKTFMNNSGSAVGAIARRYRLQPGDILVVYDDIDLPLGKLRIRMRGSSGGHKGVNSIIQALGSSDFPRIRVGIGRSGDAIDYVLSRFTRREREIIDPALQSAADALEVILDEGIEAAMNKFNRGGDA